MVLVLMRMVHMMLVIGIDHKKSIKDRIEVGNMSNEIGKITYKNVNSEVAVYTELKEEYGTYKCLIGDLFRTNTEEISQILSKIDTDTKKGHLSAKEISIFNQKVKKYASQDDNKTELSENEAKSLCKELGISLKNLSNIMSLLGSNSLSKGLSKALDSGNEEQMNMLLLQLDANNVYNVIKQYNGDLIKDIQSNYGSNSKKYLDVLYAALQEAASLKNIKMK